VATDTRRQFNPHAFAASQETIYILSKEGAGSAASNAAAADFPSPRCLLSMSWPVVLASGTPATLVRTMPWYTGPHKDAVTASIRNYSPQPEEEPVPVPAVPANPWVNG
jgi:hypothetical protein